MKEINKNQIAPCGMNCGICKAYLREKNPCHGCRQAEKNIPKTRVNCKMRTCTKRKGDFCLSREGSRGDCDEFPCEQLKHLDERYRTRYNMSEIENLKIIQKEGIEKFIEEQRKKYQSSKGIYCVHDKQIYS